MKLVIAEKETHDEDEENPIKYLATNKIDAPTEHIIRSYGMRWRIETFFEDSINRKSTLTKTEIDRGLKNREEREDEVVEEGSDRTLRYTPINKKWILGILGAAIVGTVGDGGDGDEDEDEDENDKLEVTFINVGQANSILVQGPEGQNMLIDGGPRKNAGKVLEVLDEENVDVIHHLVVTHNDSVTTMGFVPSWTKCRLG